MSTEKPEKMKIRKDDKNRLACKLTSLPPSLPPTLSLFLFFFLLTPLLRTILVRPTPPSIATLEKAGLLIVQSRVLGASDKKVKDEGS